MSLITSFVGESNPILLEFEKLKERVNQLELLFNNEIQKKRGPKSKMKDNYQSYDISHDLENIIFIEREDINENYQLIIVDKNSSTNSAPIIELTDNQMLKLIEMCENNKVGDTIDIIDYEIINKFAQKDEMGDWLICIN